MGIGRQDSGPQAGSEGAHERRTAPALKRRVRSARNEVPGAAPRVFDADGGELVQRAGEAAQRVRDHGHSAQSLQSESERQARMRCEQSSQADAAKRGGSAS